MKIILEISNRKNLEGKSTSNTLPNTLWVKEEIKRLLRKYSISKL